MKLLEGGSNGRLQINITFFFIFGNSYYGYVILSWKSGKENFKKKYTQTESFKSLHRKYALSNKFQMFFNVIRLWNS